MRKAVNLFNQSHRVYITPWLLLSSGADTRTGGRLFSRATNFAKRTKVLFHGNYFRGLAFSARADAIKYDAQLARAVGCYIHNHG